MGLKTHRRVLAPSTVHQDQQTARQSASKRTLGAYSMATPEHEPTVPMPYTTKQRGKRTKHTFTTYGSKPISMQQPNEIGLIYRKGTDCVIASPELEARLSATGPSTSTRLAGYNFIW
jgi:hypothetical protein